MKRQLAKRQEQERGNNDMIRGRQKKMNMAFAEYKAALEAIKIERITAEKLINDVKNQLDKTLQNVGEVNRIDIMW